MSRDYARRALGAHPHGGGSKSHEISRDRQYNLFTTLVSPPAPRCRFCRQRFRKIRDLPLALREGFGPSTLRVECLPLRWRLHWGILAVRRTSRRGSSSAVLSGVDGRRHSCALKLARNPTISRPRRGTKWHEDDRDGQFGVPFDPRRLLHTAIQGAPAPGTNRAHSTLTNGHFWPFLTTRTTWTILQNSCDFS